MGIPKTIVWIASLSFVTLLLMTVYRMLTLSLLKIDLGSFSLNEAAWLGFRFDLRYVACIALVLFALSFIPSLHPFKHRKGKRLLTIIYSVFIGILLILYAGDFLVQLAFEKRLSVQTIQWSQEQPEKIRSTPWVILVLFAGVGTWLSYVVARALHRLQEKSKSVGTSVLRMFWQGLTLAGLTVCIYGSLDNASLRVKNTHAANDAVVGSFVINPVESLLFNPGK
ncbi:MAG TPA: hypothetical protein VLL95_03970 [Phnomibacter sp.]|nr:hypothetical protein [Phnomibacter sp.]